ncbi:hypothetical protein GDO78_017261, partial [Eleutherodactylus coqui]
KIDIFFFVLEYGQHWMFLACDSCMMISEKYLLAMFLVYFRRAGLCTEEYKKNFFPALFLANQMEEEFCFRWEIFPRALGPTWMESRQQLFKQRNQLLLRMGFRTWVDRTTCDLVMAEAPSHWAWTRERQSHHSWALHMFRRGAEDFTTSGPQFNRPTCSL